MKDGHSWIHVNEEKFGAVFDHVWIEQSWRWGVRGRRWGTPQNSLSIRHLLGLGEVGLFLRLAKLGNHLCSAALGPFLLGNRIVSAGQACLAAIPTWLLAVASDLSSKIKRQHSELLEIFLKRVKR